MASNKGYFCTDCKKNDSSTNSLKCGRHSICQECLIRRVQNAPPNPNFDCLTCKSKVYDPSYSFRDAVTSKATAENQELTEEVSCSGKEKLSDSQFFDGKMPGIWIFVDNSNIWIEAKKLMSRVKNFMTSEDPRVRIDVGKLADVIASGRPVAQGFLYGSVPPLVDSVWKKIEEKGWKVCTKQRSVITGREKQVDAQLITDVTELAIETPIHKRTTIVLVTGDADVIPALDKVIKKEPWKIEVFTWRQAIANNITKFASDHKARVEIKYLDHCLQATFTNRRFNLQVHSNNIVKEYGFVFSMAPRAFDKHDPDKAWCEHLETITQWPFEYYWFQIDKRDTDYLVIVFCRDMKIRFESDKCLEKIENNCMPKVNSVQPFLQFLQDGFKDDSEDKLSAVRSKKRSSQFYSDPCRYMYNCSYGTKCRYKHTEEERQYFRQKKDGRGNSLRKVQECKHFRASRASFCGSVIMLMGRKMLGVFTVSPMDTTDNCTNS